MTEVLGQILPLAVAVSIVSSRSEAVARAAELGLLPADHGPSDSGAGGSTRPG